MSEYERLRREAGGGATNRSSRFDSATAVARAKEQNRRTGIARGRAHRILELRYPDEYRDLFTTLLAEIRAERGSLPGDA